MDFVIDKNLLGTEQHVLSSNDRLLYVDDPSDNWHFSGSIKPLSKKCLDTLFKLERINVDMSLDPRIQKVISAFVQDNQSVPWSKLMNREHLKSRLRMLLKDIRGNLTLVNKSYYESTWVPLMTAFESLQPCAVDLESIHRLLDSSEMHNKHVLNSFLLINSDKITRPIKYNRFGTRTGRLTVESGPQVLTLNKEYRHIVKSRHPTGCVFSIDFSSLEARIILYEAGRRCSERDMYSHINSVLFGSRVDRSAVKLAVISEMYGSSRHAIASRLNMDYEEVKKICYKVKDYLQVDDLKKKKKDQYIKDGYIRNKYGRVVEIDDPSDSLVLNSYVQSTGVDVALLGFLKVIENLAKTGLGVPLFFLHDALVFDLFDMNSVDKINDSVTVPGYVQSFPLKIEKFDKYCTNT